MTTTNEEGFIVHSEKRMHLPELTEHCVLCLRAEADALRALLVKVRNSVGWWAALSYVDGPHGQPSRWTPAEQELLRRAGLDRHTV